MSLESLKADVLKQSVDMANMPSAPTLPISNVTPIELPSCGGQTIGEVVSTTPTVSDSISQASVAPVNPTEGEGEISPLGTKVASLVTITTTALNGIATAITPTPVVPSEPTSESPVAQSTPNVPSTAMPTSGLSIAKVNCAEASPKPTTKLEDLNVNPVAQEAIMQKEKVNSIVKSVKQLYEADILTHENETLPNALNALKEFGINISDKSKHPTTTDGWEALIKTLDIHYMSIKMALGKNRFGINYAPLLTLIDPFSNIGEYVISPTEGILMFPANLSPLKNEFLSVCKSEIASLQSITFMVGGAYYDMNVLKHTVYRTILDELNTRINKLYELTSDKLDVWTLYGTANTPEKLIGEYIYQLFKIDGKSLLVKDGTSVDLYEYCSFKDAHKNISEQLIAFLPK